MESKAILKVVAAFLVGVVLALGGALLHSRETTMTNAVQPAHKSPAAYVRPAPSSDKPAQTVVPEQETAKSDEAPPPAAAELATPAEPAQTKVAVPVTNHKRAGPAPQISELRSRPPLSEQAVTNQASPIVPPATTRLPQQNTTETIRQPTSATPLQSTPQRASVPNTAAPPALTPEPHVVTLPAGTTLSIRLGENLSSERNRDGDSFQGTLDAPVIANGFIIAERRSRVVGRVIQSGRAGRVKGLANLELAVSEINTTDGQRVLVETDSYQKWGNSSMKGDTAKVAGAAALGAIIGAIAGGGKGAAIGAGAGGAAGTGVALGTRGSAVSIPSESILTFRLARPATITEKFN